MRPRTGRRMAHAAALLGLLLGLLSPLCLAGAGCGRTAGPEDGFYVVSRVAPDRASLGPLAENEQALSYGEEFHDEGEPSSEIFVVGPRADVPLTLAAEPEGVPDELGRTMLRLRLADAAGDRLEAVTREHLGERMAIVVGGKVVSVHGIKAVIEGGRVQITRCSDEGCDYILSRLTGE